MLAAWGMGSSWAHAAPPSSPPSGEDAAPDGADPPPPARTPAPPRTRTPPPRTSAPPPPPSSSSDPAVDGVRDEPEGPPVDLSNTWGYARRGSPRPRYARNTQDPIIFAPNPVGFYSGVSVEGNQLPPHPARDLGGKPTVLTWAGFERTSSGSRVFFQLSAEADYSVKVKNGVLTIRMRRTKVNVRNNLRRLDLSYFKTPVRTVKVRRRGRDAVATITLKRDSTPEISYVEGKGSGYKVLVVAFTHAAASSSRRTNPSR